MNIGNPLLDDDQYFNQNSQSTLFILNEKIIRPLYETISFLSEDINFDNVSSNNLNNLLFPLNTDMQNLIPVFDSSQAYEENVGSRQDTKTVNFQDYTLEMSEIINKNISKPDLQTTIQEKLINNNKSKALFEINKKRKRSLKKKNAKKVVKRSKNYLQYPFIKAKIQKKISKKKIFQITREFIKKSSSPFYNLVLNKACKFQKLIESTCLENSKKMLNTFPLSEPKKLIFSIQRKIINKDQILNTNKLNFSQITTDFHNSHETTSPYMNQKKSLGYICMENIRLNFELQDQLHHLNLFQEDPSN